MKMSCSFKHGKHVKFVRVSTPPDVSFSPPVPISASAGENAYTSRAGTDFLSARLRARLSGPSQIDPTERPTNPTYPTSRIGPTSQVMVFSNRTGIPRCSAAVERCTSSVVALAVDRWPRQQWCSPLAGGGPGAAPVLPVPPRYRPPSLPPPAAPAADRPALSPPVQLTPELTPPAAGWNSPQAWAGPGMSRQQSGPAGIAVSRDAHTILCQSLNAINGLGFPWTCVHTFLMEFLTVIISSFNPHHGCCVSSTPNKVVKILYYILWPTYNLQLPHLIVLPMF